MQHNTVAIQYKVYLVPYNAVMLPKAWIQRFVYTNR